CTRTGRWPRFSPSGTSRRRSWRRLHRSRRPGRDGGRRTVAVVLLSVQFDWSLFFHRLFDPTSEFWHGLIITIMVAIVAQVIGVVIGGVLVAASRSWRPLRMIAYTYVLVFRGTPLIVQVFFLYFGANIFLGFTLFPREVGLFGVQ